MSDALQTKRVNKSPIKESYNVTEEGTLLEVLQAKSNCTRSTTKKLLASGRIAVDGYSTTSATLPLTLGQKITVHTAAVLPPFRHEKVEIIWEDDDYLLIYKKAGIPTVNTGHRKKENTALWLLSNYYKAMDPHIKIFMVNRLDNNSEGFVLLAKEIKAKELLVEQWGRVVKSQRFILCVEGTLESDEGQFVTKSQPSNKGKANTTKGGKTKIEKRVTTQYKVLKRGAYKRMMILQVDVPSTRIFNLRKIMGDEKLSIYGDIRSRSHFKTTEKIALSQVAFSFVHPKTHQLHSFERKFPAHLFNLLREEKKLLLGNNITKRRSGEKP